MVMEIIREGLIITPTGSLEPSQGSYDVPVKLINDETYSDYTINMYVGYYVNGAMKKRKCETDSEGHYLIPGIAFLRSGIISISFLLETTDKSQGLMTNALSYEIKHAPNVVVEVPADPTWQELVKEWIQELAGAVNVDNTLTKSGMAADAKATGDAISKLSDSKANKTYVDGEIAKAQLEGAGVDTSQFVTQDDLKNISDEIDNLKENGSSANLSDIFKLVEDDEIFSIIEKSGIYMENSISLEANTNYTFNVTYTDDIVAPNFIWTTSNDDVAIVENGIVTWVGVGSATIRCALRSDLSVYAECVVTCNAEVVYYVKNGLEFRLDGIENTPNGHNANVGDNWYDISGNDYEVVKNNWSEVIINDNHYYSEYRFTTDIVDYTKLLGKLSSFTFEFVCTPNNLNNRAPLLSFGKGDANYLAVSSGQLNLGLGLKGTVYTETDTIKHITVTYDGSKLSLYHESVLDIAVDYTFNTDSYTKVQLFGDQGYANHQGGKFYGVRIYTRALTQEEIKYNYDLDVVRFGG